MTKRTIYSLIFVFIFIFVSCTPGATTPSGTNNSTPGTGTTTGAETLVPSGPVEPILPGPTPSTPYAPTAPSSAKNLDGAEVVLINGGTFTVGTNQTAALKNPVEIPDTSVTLNSFYLYAHEVTMGQYRACVAAGGCIDVVKQMDGPTSHYGDKAYDLYPVTGVDWLMAKDYCKWAGGRLPSEAEWEAAARSNTASLYPWGNDAPTCDRTNMKSCGVEAAPAQVGSYPSGATPTKLFDMAGNVWEWVNDWYSPDHTIVSGVNPFGPLTGVTKVIKGGGYQSQADKLRSAVRLPVDPSYGYNDLGFRCVANPPGVYTPVVPPPSIHRRSGDGGTTIDDGGTGRRSGPSAWIAFYGEKCDSDGTFQIAFTAANSFGGTYGFTFDGADWACNYDTASNLLVCQGRPAATPSDGVAYHWEVTVTSSTLGLQPWAGMSGTRPPDIMSSCTGIPPEGRDGRFYVDTTASCPSSGMVSFSFVSPMVNITRIAYGGTDLAAGACVGLGTTTVNCLAAATPTDGIYTLHAWFTSFSGETTFDMDIGVRSAVECPATSDHFNLQVTSRCSESAAGRYDVDINWMPDTWPVDWLGGTFGFDISGCRQVSPGRIYCPQAGIASGGLVHSVFGFNNGTGGAFTYPAAFMAPSHCIPGEERGSESWSLAVTCRSDAATDAIQLSIGYPSSLTIGGYRVTDDSSTTYGCLPDPFVPNQIDCSIPRPSAAPGPLNACILGTDGVEHCHAFDAYASLIPTTACNSGGSPEGDAWRFNEVTCSGEGTILFSLHTPSAVNWIAGRAQAGTQTFECRQDPGDSHRIVCGGARPAGTSPLEVCIADVTGTEYCNTYADFASRIPADCGPTGNTPEVSFRTSATCGDSAGRYNLDIAWSPADYFVYRVDDAVAGGIAGCGDAVSGTLHCNNLQASVADGLVHAVVIHRPSADSLEETSYPLDVIPPVCNGDSTPREGYTLHDAACAPGGLSLLIDYPSTEEFESGYATIGSSTLTCSADATTAHRIICTGPAFTVPASLVLHMTVSGGTSGDVTFTLPAEWTVPTCGSDPGGTGGWGMTARCASPEYIRIDITTPARPAGIVDVTGVPVILIDTLMPTTTMIALVDPAPGPLGISFNDSAGNRLSHTFLEYATLAPRTCSGSPGGEGGITINANATCGLEKSFDVLVTALPDSTNIIDITTPGLLNTTFTPLAPNRWDVNAQMTDSSGRVPLHVTYSIVAPGGGSTTASQDLLVDLPYCGDEPTGGDSGWSIRRGCGIFEDYPDSYGIEITAPMFEVNERVWVDTGPAGCLMLWEVTQANQLRIMCSLPVDSTDLLANANSNDGLTALGSHDFGPANTDAPATCGTTPQANGDWTIRYRCDGTINPGYFAFDFTYPDYGSAATTIGSHAIAGCYWLNYSADHRITYECDPARYTPGTIFLPILGLADGRRFEPSFGPLDSMITSCSNTPTTTPTGGWDIQAWCENGHPHLRLFPDTAARTSAVVDNVWPGATAWLTDYSPYGGADYYSPIDVVPPYDWVVTDTLTWNFVGPAPDYARITHTFTGLRSIVPSTCTPITPPGGVTDNPGALITDWTCAPSNSTQFNIYLFNYPQVPTGLTLTQGSLAFACAIDPTYTSPFPTSKRFHCIGGIPSAPGVLTVNTTMADGSTNSTVTFDLVPDWIPRNCGGGTPTGGLPPPQNITPVPQLTCEQHSPNNCPSNCYLWGGLCNSYPPKCYYWTDQSSCDSAGNCCWNGSQCLDQGSCNPPPFDCTAAYGKDSTSCSNDKRCYFNAKLGYCVNQ